MAIDIGSTERRPEPERVFEVLDDDACRDIVSALEEPMSVPEIADAADVPLSTTYRKLDRLEAASLVDERLELRSGGHHRARYVRDFEQMLVGLDEESDFQVGIDRPLADPERQLVDIWSEVRRET